MTLTERKETSWDNPKKDKSTWVHQQDTRAESDNYTLEITK